MRHSLLLPTVSILVLAAAGCGGGPGAIRKSVSRQAYLTHADAICAEMDARLAALGVPRRPEDFPPFARKAAPVIESSLGRLRGVKPPEDLAVRVNQFEAGLAAAVDRMRKAGAAAESGNVAAAERLGNEAKVHAEAASRAAHRVGYRVCGRFPGL